jgi:hypothetical protein
MMSADVLRWVIGLAVIAHGIGHVLFMPALAPVMRLEASGRSWLVTGLLGDPATQAIATVVAAAAGLAFIVAGAGILAQASWWRPLAIGAAVVSLVLVALMWGGIPHGSAAWAVAFDVAVLVGLAVLHWPSREALGA